MTCHACDGSRLVVGVDELALPLPWNVAGPTMLALQHTAKHRDAVTFYERVAQLMGSDARVNDGGHVLRLFRMLTRPGATVAGGRCPYC